MFVQVKSHPSTASEISKSDLIKKYVFILILCAPITKWMKWVMLITVHTNLINATQEKAQCASWFIEKKKSDQ